MVMETVDDVLGRVVRPVQRKRKKSVHARDVDDVPLRSFAEMRQEFTGSVDHPPEIDVDHPLEILPAHRLEPIVDHHARVVDDYVHSTVVGHGRISEGLHRRPVAYVHPGSRHPDRPAAEQSRRLLEAVLVDVAERKVATFVGQALREPAAEAGARSRHRRDFSS